MSIYSWLGETPNAFELRVLPNLRTFVGAYTPSTQAIDLLGERWVGRIDLPPTTDPIIGGRREAYWDRLKGQAHQFQIWNFKRPSPLGTIAGTPTLAAAVAQLANTCTLQTTAGATVLTGDMIGLPNGQTVRSMVDATANGAGLVVVEFQPRARSAMGSGGGITLIRPLITVMRKTSDGIPTTWQPGYADGCSFEFVEVP